MIYPVMTMRAECDDGPMFLDLIGCFSTLKRAEGIIKQIESREEIPGLDYNELQPFDAVALLGSFELNRVVQNENRTQRQLGHID